MTSHSSTPVVRLTPGRRLGTLAALAAVGGVVVAGPALAGPRPSYVLGHEGTAITSLRAAVASPAVTRTEVIARAQSWVSARPPVPYSQTHFFASPSSYWGDGRGGDPSGWREDCSGFVSRAWKIAAPGLTTASLPSVSTPIAWSQLQPGDALLRRDSSVHHTALFVRWDDAAHTSYTLYAEADEVQGTVVQNGVRLTDSFWRTFTPIRYTGVTGSGGGSAVSHDFTRDRHADVLARDPAGNLLVYPGNGVGGFTGRRVTVGTGAAGLTAMAGAGDFTGDRQQDMLGRDAAGDLLLYSGSAVRFSATPTRVGVGWASMTALIGGGDFTGDRRPDLLARDAAGELLLYPGNGVGGFTGERLTLSVGWARITALLSVGDFTGDGRDDLVARSSAGDLYVYRGTSSGVSTSATRIGVGWASMTAIVGAGDLSGDGNPDILARTAGGILVLYPGDGAGGFRRPSAVGNGWTSFTIAG